MAGFHPPKHNNIVFPHNAFLCEKGTVSNISYEYEEERINEVYKFFQSIIHEFDPWFNYRATYQMVTTNFYDFLNWFDELAWYPLGRIVGGTVYPGLMITAGAIHYVLNGLGFTTHIQVIEDLL